MQSDFLAMQQKTWKHTATSFSSINMESSFDYMTGGTLTLTVDQWSSRVFKKDADSSGMGQWSYQTLVGKKTQKSLSLQGINVCKMPMPTAVLGPSKRSI